MNLWKSKIITAICVLGIIFVLFWLDNRNKLDLVKFGILKAEHPISSSIAYIRDQALYFSHIVFSLPDIVKENTLLLEKNYKLEQELSSYQGLKEENTQLRTQLGFFNQQIKNVVPCTVLGNDPTGTTGQLQISCGEDKGVAIGMIVVADSHVVGRVIYVGKYFSSIRPISHAQSVIPAQTASGDIQGTLKGTFGSGVSFELPTSGLSPTEGEMIVTSAIGENAPAGLLIGKLGKSIKDSSNLINQYTVNSPVYIQRLKFVFVIAISNP